VSGAALRHEVGADAAVAASIEHCVHVLRERLGSRLVGIVLTGSFARGEGTVVPIDGHLRVLGDIEFLVILPHGRDYRALRPALAGWSRQVSQTLGEQGVRVDVEFGPAEESYLRRRARPSIFVYELRTHASSGGRRTCCGASRRSAPTPFRAPTPST
jgi:predicted nucleotidyltransferase